ASRSGAAVTLARASRHACGVVRDHASGSALATMAGWNPANAATTGPAGTGPSGAAPNAKEVIQKPLRPSAIPAGPAPPAEEAEAGRGFEAAPRARAELSLGGRPGLAPGVTPR